jgi:cytosine/adenosine deaminase-related metal-dependent hydrolase
MVISTPELALRARWVLPVASPPIADGLIVVRGSEIVSVGVYSGEPARDLGDVAILPGLVNAHTHLEFSGLAAPLGTPGMPLPTWIRHTVSARRATDPAEHDGAVTQGLRESLAASTTTVGEIATRDWRESDPQVARLKPDVRIFFELIAPVVQRVPAALVAAEQFARGTTSSNILPGLSPHAPYTVHPQLLSGLVELAGRFQIPLAMHLAESPEELELLRSGGGPFAELLRDFGAWDADPAARYPQVLDYLRQLAGAPRSLVIHGNYLDDQEIEFLSVHAATMTVVYCPRTHHFFGHPRYPLARLLNAGVALALGTDSRASNPDLSLFDELRFVAAEHTDVEPATLLRLATLGGAQALGLADRIGTLEPGKRANFAVVQLGERVADPHAAILASTARVRQVWIGGELAHTD